MSLTSDDVALIGKLLDEKLSQVQAVERRRRRFWLWFWIALFVLSSIFSWIAAQKMMDQVKSELGQMEDSMREARVAYQRELQHNAVMQAERKQAEANTGYQSQQDQATYEAGLMRAAFQAINQQHELSRRLENLDPDDPEALVQATEDMSASLNAALGTLGQVLLRNTDPAHTPTDERILVNGEGVEPVVAPVPVPAPGLDPVPTPPPAP